MAGRFSIARLSLKGAWHHRRSYVYVLLSASVGTAVIAGALLVGDSVRGSLADRVAERLGRFDHAVVGATFFREGLAAELAASPAVSAAVPAILLGGSVRHADTGLRSGTANIIGVTAEFWDEWGGAGGAPAGLADALTGRRAILNATAAARIGASAGDSVLIHFEDSAEIPAEHAFGKRATPPPALRLEVVRVLPDEGLAIFEIENGQRPPANVFVPRRLLGAGIDKEGRINAVLLRAAVPGGPGVADASSRIDDAIARAWTLEDAGLSLRADPALGSVALESRELLLPPAAVDAARSAPVSTLVSMPGVERLEALTHLSNTLSAGERETPYSTVCAVGDWAPVGERTPAGGTGAGAAIFPGHPIAEGDIILNDWTAADLGVREGDNLRMAFYVVGADHELREETAEFTVRGIVPIEGWAADPGWTPDYPGISDARSLRDWDPPFPIDFKRIRPKDEAYWDDHRATPKAFVSLRDGERLWASRFGNLTSIRFRAPRGEDLESLATAIDEELRARLSPAACGAALRPVREEGLRAAAGSTDFGGLFLALSSFLIASSLILLSMVFRLALLRRSRELGILAAVGFSGGRILSVLLLEAAWTILWGTALGIVGGIAYAALLVEGLRTLWKDAVSASFLTLHVAPGSLVAGGLATGLLAIATTFSVSRRIARTEPRDLLASRGHEPAAPTMGRRLRARASIAIAVATTASAAGVVSLGALGRGIDPYAAFFLGGGLLLVAGLALADWALRRPSRGVGRGRGLVALSRLGAGYARRAPGRSLLTVALIASASFVLVSVAASRIDRREGGPSLASGDGGFALLGRSAVPITASLGGAAGREALGLSPETSRILEGCSVFPFRVRPGEDVSCLNLYRPGAPRILGVAGGFLARGGFAWSGSLAETAAERENPWRLLDRDLPDGAIPTVGDASTVTWILHSGLGEDLEILDDRGGALKLRIVGVLAGSIFQGELLVSERRFLERFPRVSGSAFFLFEAPEAVVADLTAGLENDLADMGFDAETTAALLEGYASVANTYLLAFQALGGLGLLLGTVGLGAILARNMVERRAELALLGAVGYSPRALGWIVLSETLLLLAAGLAVGSLSPIVCLVPVARGGVGGISIGGLGIALACVLVAGLLSSVAALRAALRAPLIAALREE